MTTQAEFFQAHAVDGKLTDAQMVQLLELPEGDTSTTLETSGEPDVTTTANEKQPAAEPGKPNDTTNDGATAPAAPSEPDPAKAVVLAKDGVHTIPYERLEQARQGEQHWKAQAAAALQQLEALQAQADQRAEAGKAPTRQDQAVATAAAVIEQGVDPAIFGDFTEAAIAKGLKALVDQQAPTLREQLKAELLSEVRAELKAELAPIQQRHAKTANDAHLGAIYAAHPDADSLVESKELNDWIEAQPAFVRKAYRDVLSPTPGVGGSAEQVIEFFDTFKRATGKAQPPAAPAKADVAAAAQAAIAKAKPAVPASLTDLPGGTAGATDEMEAMRNMPATDLMAKLEGKSPEQIAALIARLI